MFELIPYILHSKTNINAKNKRSPNEEEFKLLIQKHIPTIKKETLIICFPIH